MWKTWEPRYGCSEPVWEGVLMTWLQMEWRWVHRVRESTWSDSLMDLAPGGGLEGRGLVYHQIDIIQRLEGCFFQGEKVTDQQ